jgi:hypothetical protein
MTEVINIDDEISKEEPTVINETPEVIQDIGLPLDDIKPTTTNNKSTRIIHIKMMLKKFAVELSGIPTPDFTTMSEEELQSYYGELKYAVLCGDNSALHNIYLQLGIYGIDKVLNSFSPKHKGIAAKLYTNKGIKNAWEIYMIEKEGQLDANPLVVLVTNILIEISQNYDTNKIIELQQHQKVIDEKLSNKIKIESLLKYKSLIDE